MRVGYDPAPPGMPKTVLCFSSGRRCLRFGPMETHRRRIIWFCSTETIAKGPEAMRRLRDEIGLTTIMPESPVCHTSGFRASDALAARGVRFANHYNQATPCGPSRNW